MAMKDFQLKQFLIQHGEKVGLGIAVTVMVVCLAMGAMAVLDHKSPEETAGKLETVTKRIQQAIQAGGTTGESPAAGQTLDDDVTKMDVDPHPFHSDVKISYGRGTQSQGRTEPAILNVADSEAIEFRGQAKHFDFNGGMMTVIVNSGGDDNYKARIAGALKARPVARGGMVGNPGTGPKPPAAQGQPQLQSFKIDQIPAGSRPASIIHPTRMAIVHASFPYGEQTSLFERSLHCTTQQLKDERILPNVNEILVERRTQDETGKETEAWRRINFAEDYKPILAWSVANHPEDPDLRPLESYFPNMAYARPLLAHGDYPPVGEKLKVKEYLRSLAGKEQVVPDFVPPVRDTPREVGSMFSGPTGASKPKDPVKPPPGGEKEKDKEKKDEAKPAKGKKDDKNKLVIPKFVLVRFCDVTVRPGFTYQYRIKVRMANPNFGKTDKVAYESLATEKPELESPAWGPVDPQTRKLAPISVTISQELFHYAVVPDTRFLKDKPGWMQVQVHRWVETTRPMAGVRESFQVGEWAIANLAVRRGEYVGRTEMVEMPIWMEDRDRFDFPTPQAPKRVALLVRPKAGPRGIAIDFVSQDILVDWEGGKVVQSFKTGPRTTKDIKEDSAVEILLLSPDGKLQLRNSNQDAGNFERVTRLNNWEKNVQDAIKQIVNPNPGGAGDPKGTGTKPMTGTPMPGTKPSDFFKKP